MMAKSLHPEVPGQTYSSVVLSSPVEILGLKELVTRVSHVNDIFFDPEFFLSSVSLGWRPTVVVVYKQADVAGIIYAKEKSVLGFGLGVIYADLSWGALLFGEEVQREETFRTALKTLLTWRRIRGIRLRILPGSPESAAVRKVIASRDLPTHLESG